MSSSLFLFLLSMAGASAPPEFPLPGEWPSFRANAALDAHVTVRGKISQPQVAWRTFVGLIDTDFELTPESRASTPPAMGATDPRWGLSAPIDNADGRNAVLENTGTVTYADVLPDAPGLEKIEFESGFNIPTVNGQWQPAVGRCFAWKDGAWAKVWETEPIAMLFQPLPLAGDFDHDGQPEIALLPWYELLILDARTGKVKDRCKFTEGRSYGAFYADDLDGDGVSEFIVLADFAKHIDVLGYRNGKLDLFWKRDIELTLENPQKMLRAHPHPLADLDGGGRKELVVNVYNDTGDGEWHLMIFDGLKGTVLLDAPGTFVQGLADMNADKSSELFTVQSKGISLPEYGAIRVCSFKDGRIETLWQADAAAWQIWEPPLPNNTNSAATRGREDVLVRDTAEGKVAVVRTRGKAGEDITLTLLHTGAQGFTLGPSVAGPRLKGLALDPEGALLFRTTTPEGVTATPTADRAVVTRLNATPRGFAAHSTPVVVRQQEGPPVIVLQTPVEEIALLQAQSSAAPNELRRFPGRGQSMNWPDCFGPVVSDLAGDGGRQLLYATTAPEGCARFAAADLMGKELWHHDFPAIPGAAPVWNTGGIILWQTGHFTDRQRRDVLVTVRRTIMHSDETYLLSGRDGSEVWRRTSQISGRGVGGQPFAVADFDGDGLDDAASFYPSLFYILKGATGADLIAMDTVWKEVPAKPVYWGAPVAGDFENNGSPTVFFATERRSMTGLVRPDGTLVWWDTLDRSGTVYPAFGRFDSTGRMEAIIPGYDDGLRCYDTATGKILWRMTPPVPENPVGCASADIDSCGRDEALFTAGRVLYCIATGNDGAGVVKWQLSLPAHAGRPVIADVDGSGTASILTVGLDGYLYCIR